MVRDITHERRVERALQHMQERYHALIQTAEDVIYTLNLRGQIETLNPAFQRVSGYSIAQWLGQEFRGLIHPEDLPLALDTYARVARGEKIAGIEVRVRTASGEFRFFDIHSVPLYHNGRIEGVIGIARDITQRHNVQLELQQAREAAETANRAKDRFLATLSHELRTPLTPIVPVLDALLADNSLPAQVHADLEVVRRNVQLETRLIDDLLDITRIARGKIKLKHALVDLHALIHTTLGICHADWADKQLRLHLELDAPQYHVSGDWTRLQQILWNLLKNAAKFTPSGGKITVRTCLGDPRSPRACDPDEPRPPQLRPHVVVQVTDTGLGIKPEQLKSLFQPFAQADSPDAVRQSGLGLGLFISRTIAELHHGRLTAHSEGMGKGATFELVLPLAAQRAHDATYPDRDQPAQERTLLRTLDILLVEDHADTALVLAKVLRLHGHTVQTVSTVRGGRDLAATHRFDLLISDIGLPDGTGLDLLTSLRREGRAPPAIALSGYGMEEDIQKSRAAGFAEHITKPVNPAALLEAIQRILTHAEESGLSLSSPGTDQED